MLDLLKSVISDCEGCAEIRYHKRIHDIIEARNGALTKVEHRTLAGAGVRVLVDGGWGFVSTNDVTESGLRKALSEAQAAAWVGAAVRKQKAQLAPSEPARGELVYYDAAREPDIAEKIRAVLEAEKRIRDRSPLIVGSIVRYTQYEDEKYSHLRRVGCPCARQ